MSNQTPPLRCLVDLQDSQPPTAAELPITFGHRPPTEPSARAAAARQLVASASAALERLRQLKLRLAAAEGTSEADCRLLQAEAAADLQAQSLLAHWGLQAACDARQAQAAHEAAAP